MTVEGTVEDRILALQEKKQQVADAILDEGGRQSSSRLGLNDLMNLFNVNRELEDD
jgi:SNF2 family DNA or RNA helicase